MTESLKNELIYALKILIYNMDKLNMSEEKLRILIRSTAGYVFLTELKTDEINKALKAVGFQNPAVACNAMLAALQNDPRNAIPVIIIDDDNTGQMYLLTHGILC